MRVGTCGRCRCASDLVAAVVPCLVPQRSSAKRRPSPGLRAPSPGGRGIFIYLLASLCRYQCPAGEGGRRPGEGRGITPDSALLSASIPPLSQVSSQTIVGKNADPHPPCGHPLPVGEGFLYILQRRCVDTNAREGWERESLFSEHQDDERPGHEGASAAALLLRGGVLLGGGGGRADRGGREVEAVGLGI